MIRNLTNLSSYSNELLDAAGHLIDLGYMVTMATNTSIMVTVPGSRTCVNAVHEALGLSREFRVERPNLMAHPILERGTSAVKVTWIG